MKYQYGIIITPAEDTENSTCPEYNAECVDDAQFVSFISPESPDGSNTIVYNNITNQPIGPLQIHQSQLHQRRVDLKPINSGECRSIGELSGGLVDGADKPDKCNKRIRGGSTKVIEKVKKIKIDDKNDSENERQGGFDHLESFLSNIQQLNDSNLSIELDVSYSAFKLKLNYNFE